MTFISKCKEKIFSGEQITKEEALLLFEQNTTELCKAADEIREHFCGNDFDICTIINAKSGRCSENCKYCAQSAHYTTKVETYPLLPVEKILEEAKSNSSKGVIRYAMVTSGRKLNSEEIDKVCCATKEIKKETPLAVCASLGLLNKEEFTRLKAAGLSRIHCNLETSEKFFPSICTTHSYEEKITTIKAAQEAGLSVCSGGIMGLGESAEDRVDLAITLRDLNIKSIPINFLNPIKGTPLENNTPLTDEEKRKIIAVYRFLLPDSNIRLAGGRGLIHDKGEECFRSGANAAISGDMLTTAGITIKTDMELLQKLNYKVVLKDE